MQQYIEITQDAAGIITSQTSADYQGLYTSGIETCVAIAIKGSDGVMLIHHSGRLGQASIRDILGEIGEIQSVQMFAHEALYFEQNISLIKRQNQRLFPGIQIPDVIFVTDGAVSIDRDFNCKTDLIESSDLITPVKRELRVLTNKLNNLIADELNVDVQFDGQHLTPCTTLIEPIAQTEIRLRTNPKYNHFQRTILREAIEYYKMGLFLDSMSFESMINSSFFGPMNLDESDEKISGPDMQGA